jgi:hypothetical protein
VSKNRDVFGDKPGSSRCSATKEKTITVHPDDPGGKRPSTSKPVVLSVQYQRNGASRPVLKPRPAQKLYSLGSCTGLVQAGFESGKIRINAHEKGPTVRQALLILLRLSGFNDAGDGC